LFAISRSSGVQLHVTSLPGGRLGAAAYEWVDWLQAAGQSWWQVLPLGPPDRHRSPYKAASAFAAWRGFLSDSSAGVTPAEAEAFRERNAYWIGDWEAFAGTRAVADQVRFEREWSALRSYAAQRGVRIIGDVPIYVAPGGADHRAHPELFRDGVQAGAPPDAYTDKGQLWGNPIYDWPALRRRGYRWWVRRLARTFDLFDLARIDHFRGFVAYWATPAGAPDTRSGRWVRGPGGAPFAATARALGVPPTGLPLIAEDLGVITPPVERLRDALGLPGMVVLQFAFDPDDPDGPHRPENHRPDQVLYTGTHDNDTLRGWWESIPGARRAEARAALRAAGIDDPEPWWALTRLALGSPARLCMLQAQDLLGLGAEARMNFPGRAGGSWRWGLAPGQLGEREAARLREMTVEAGRTHG
jgi:4-alpha-glucanotransferase